jgi:hypothetical protein
MDELGLLLAASRALLLLGIASISAAMLEEEERLLQLLTECWFLQKLSVIIRLQLVIHGQ